MRTKLAKCCFFIPLQIGVLILGYLQLLIACTMIIVSYIKNLELYRLEISGKGQITVDTQFRNQEGNTTTIRTARALLFTNMAFGVFIGVHSLLAIAGGHNNNPKLLRIYFWTSIISCLATVVITTMVMVTMSPKITNVIPNVLGLVFTMYSLIVVQSAYIEMERERIGDTERRNENHEECSTNVRPTMTPE